MASEQSRDTIKLNLHLARLPVHYGWIIVIIGSLTVFSCVGLARFGYSMLLPGMQANLQLSYDQMGFISTVNFVGYLIAVGCAPFLISRLGPRWTISTGLLFLGLCMVATGFASHFFHILLLYGLTGFGSGMANVPVMVLVSRWFVSRQRGRAAGFMLIGNGVAIIFAGMLIPHLNSSLGAQGWRSGWWILGLLSILICLLAGIFLRNDPGELGLEASGKKVEAQAARKWTLPKSANKKILLHLGLLYAIFGSTYMVYGTFIVTSMVTERGFDEALAGRFWAWVGCISLVSGPFFGFLSDKIGRKGGLMVVFGVQTLAYALLMDLPVLIQVPRGFFFPYVCMGLLPGLCQQ